MCIVYMQLILVDAFKWIELYDILLYIYPNEKIYKKNVQVHEWFFLYIEFNEIFALNQNSLTV